jgi:NADH pyrophosphatase NudC (nudix superfamily)
MILLACAVLVAGAIVFTLAVRAGDLPEAAPPSPVQHLEDRKAAIYENLRDLQFEFRLGKLSDADYNQTKLDLQKELAAVTAEIERVNGQAPAAKPPAPQPAAATACAHCGATFDRPLKFCGECGQPMSGGAG